MKALTQGLHASCTLIGRAFPLSGPEINGNSGPNMTILVMAVNEAKCLVPLSLVTEASLKAKRVSSCLSEMAPAKLMRRKELIAAQRSSLFSRWPSLPVMINRASG